MWKSNSLNIWRFTLSPCTHSTLAALSPRLLRPMYFFPYLSMQVVGEVEEFNKRAKWVWENIQFQKDVNVSVFETNIRVLGGLLTAHLIYGLLQCISCLPEPCT